MCVKQDSSGGVKYAKKWEASGKLIDDESGRVYDEQFTSDEDGENEVDLAQDCEEDGESC